MPQFEYEHPDQDLHPLYPEGVSNFLEGRRGVPQNIRGFKLSKNVVERVTTITEKVDLKDVEVE